MIGFPNLSMGIQLIRYVERLISLVWKTRDLRNEGFVMSQ